MHIEFLVEEPSAEAFLNNVIPKIIGQNATYQIHTFQGKPDLLKKLPNRLNGYSKWLPNNWKIVVLLDADQDNCKELKTFLEESALKAGLTTKTSTGGIKSFQVLNRIAVEELEAWFFGDMQSIKLAYPRISEKIINQAGYRNPDCIKGGTSEALERLLMRSGYHQGGLAKITAAKDISCHFDPQKNCSPSFQTFYTGLQALLK